MVGAGRGSGRGGGQGRVDPEKEVLDGGCHEIASGWTGRARIGWAAKGSARIRIAMDEVGMGWLG